MNSTARWALTFLISLFSTAIILNSNFAEGKHKEGKNIPSGCCEMECGGFCGCKCKGCSKH